jgi:hypothetical protein
VRIWMHSRMRVGLKADPSTSHATACFAQDDNRLNLAQDDIVGEW